MQSSQNRRYEVFIHNNEVTCFHVVLQATQKLIVMNHHNFKDEALIKDCNSSKNEWDGQEAQG